MFFESQKYVFQGITKNLLFFEIEKLGGRNPSCFQITKGGGLTNLALVLCFCGTFSYDVFKALLSVVTAKEHPAFVQEFIFINIVCLGK